MREVGFALERITQRTNGRAMFEAKLHGAELKLPTPSMMPMQKLSPEKEASIKKASSEAFERLKNRAQNGIRV